MTTRHYDNRQSVKTAAYLRQKVNFKLELHKVHATAWIQHSPRNTGRDRNSRKHLYMEREWQHMRCEPGRRSSYYHRSIRNTPRPVLPNRLGLCVSKMHNPFVAGHLEKCDYSLMYLNGTPPRFLA